MALSPKGEIIVQQKINEYVDKQEQYVTARIANEDASGHLADMKLLLFTCFQLYSENDVDGLQGFQDDPIQQSVSPNPVKE